MAIILGIDPGSIRTGWGVISSGAEKVNLGKMTCLGVGVIYLGEKLPFHERLAILRKSLNDIVLQYRPHSMAVEKVFMGKNADSAFKLGHARGIALEIAGTHEIKLAEYATRHAKKMLTGSGSATKEQVQFMVQHMLNIKVDALDATDALALAVCHAHECEVTEAFERQQEREL